MMKVNFCKTTRTDAWRNKRRKQTKRRRRRRRRRRESREEMRESPGRQAARGRWVIEGGKAGRLCSRNEALAYIFLYILLATPEGL
jgi:IS4 transposase